MLTPGTRSKEEDNFTRPDFFNPGEGKNGYQLNGKLGGWKIQFGHFADEIC
jgi:hypothetical protein